MLKSYYYCQRYQFFFKYLKCDYTIVICECLEVIVCRWYFIVKKIGIIAYRLLFRDKFIYLNSACFVSINEILLFIYESLRLVAYNIWL